MVDIPRYPSRQSHFAHKFCRLLFKTCAAAEIGLDGVAMLCHIAHLEDSRHYRGPIRLWNAHLQSTLGASEDTVCRIRAKNIKHGWLHYYRETNRSIGYYWVLIPEEVAGMPDGELEGETELEELIEQQNNPRESAGNAAGNAAGTSNPIPNPNPKEDVRSGSGKKKQAKKEASGYSQAFKDWYAEYPRKIAKAKAAESFTKAIGRLLEDDDRNLSTEVDAIEFLKQRAQAYAIEVKGDELKHIAHPSTWLNGDRFDDEYAADIPEPNAVATRADIEAAGYTWVEGDE